MDGTTGFVVNLRGEGTRLNEGLHFMRAIGRILSACPVYHLCACIMTRIYLGPISVMLFAKLEVAYKLMPANASIIPTML